MPDDSVAKMSEQTLLDKGKTEAKRCVNCKWWLKAFLAADENEAWGDQQFNFGECRQSPPTALPGNRVYESAGEAGKPKATVSIKQARFPHTYHDDWCGSWEHKT